MLFCVSISIESSSIPYLTSNMPPKRKHRAGTRHGSSASSSVSTIIPSSLFLGPCSAASSSAFLAANSITEVLSIGSTPSPKVAGVSYHRLTLTDSVSSSLATTLSLAIPIITAAISSNQGRGAILVHCAAGVSRSPAIVVGYLMQERGMRLREALGLVVRERPQVSPNSGFISGLKELEVELFGGETMAGLVEMPRREVDRLALFAEKGASPSYQ